ncbi:MAG: hypothetical protein EPO51_14605 [Phenylobacterium sp.]|uniref:hypothetical protein n=1 Tax=Phenylobacterium sp. TaxID=1871053 RepID=UPI0012007DF6|nr:hypothetical protein [Phenylobacterium sp.]TAJ71506.1 MAG: hypothetical protein EPO51_14605 [Phenylobacterium sp.]
MRAVTEVSITPGDRHRLEAIVGNRNSPQKHAARAQAPIATALGLGTNEIMGRSGLSKPAVWRGHVFMGEGVDRLVRDKTRKPGQAPLPSATIARLSRL